MDRAARQWGPPLLGMPASVATSFSAVEQSCQGHYLLPPFSYTAAAAIASTLCCLFLGATTSVGTAESMQENITVENPLNLAKLCNSRQGSTEEYLPAYLLSAQTHLQSPGCGPIAAICLGQSESCLLVLFIIIEACVLGQESFPLSTRHSN